MKQSVQQVKRKQTSAINRRRPGVTRLRPSVIRQSNHARLANNKWEHQADKAAGHIHKYLPTQQQQVFANHTAVRLVAIQAKLSLGRLGDHYEHEADQVTEQVMRLKSTVVADPFLSVATRPSIQRLAPGFSATISIAEGDYLQAKEIAGGTAELTTKLQDEISALRGDVGGRSLPSQIRSFFEPRFGHDFSQVRIHTDDRSAKLASSIQAKAFTIGRDIAFARGQYSPYSESGRKLLAHELTHTIQQGASSTQRAGADGVQRQPISVSPAPSYRIQRQCPAGITYNLGIHPAHVPHCGGVSVTAAAQPANIPNLVWSLRADSANVAAGTTINQQGEITIDAAQTPGTITVRATVPPAGVQPGCRWDRSLRIRSHPAGISRTIVIGPPPNAANNYGGVFDHVFTPNAGVVADLENVAVGERFPAIPNPNGTNHAGIPTPFGAFTLHTANLTANATNNWFLDAQGRLNGTDDRVTFAKAGANVGLFLQSASNPNPNRFLPVSFTLNQDLHWYCRTQAAANRWTQFVRVPHKRGLELAGNNVEFVTTVNNTPRRENYTGHPTFINARAIPRQIYVGQTATIRVDSLPHPLPAGHAFAFSIQGNALGAVINNAGVVTAGAQSGQITIRVRDSVAGNPNFDQLDLTIVQPQIFNARTIPRTVTVSPAAGNPHTVTVLADTNPDPLPAGHQLRFAIQGNNLGCNINANTGVLTVGQQAGNVVVRVRDSAAANPNFSDVTVNIINP